MNNVDTMSIVLDIDPKEEKNIKDKTKKVIRWQMKEI